jgi:hypothetical protein
MGKGRKMRFNDEKKPHIREITSDPTYKYPGFTTELIPPTTINS